jgi:serine/threonine-protein kinase
MTSGEARQAQVLGALLGNYRVLAKIGDGGMGEVYVGRHEALGHRVAVKVLRPEMSRDADMVRRFFNEAQAATAIRNPGIVQIFDFGKTADGRAYFVMELLDGQSLAARLKERHLDHAECCRLGRQAANVLQAAHAAGITHRDLKPDNLFLVPDTEVIGGERVKVLDFGIAKLTGELRGSSVKTRTGLMMGTPHYMSPEQARGAGEVDARSDIYSLGCILFEVACGRPPFVGEGVGGILGAHQYVDPPQPRSLASDIPGKLAKLILQMLAKQPEGRPQTMAAVGQALEEILRTLQAPSKRAPTAASQPKTLIVPPPTTLGSAVVTMSTTAGARRRGLPLVIGGGAIVGVAIALVAGARSAGSSELAVAEATTAVASAEVAKGADVDIDIGVAVQPPSDAQIAADPPLAPDIGELAPPPTPTPTDLEEIDMTPQATPEVAAGNPPIGTSEIEIECRRYLSNQRWADLDACADRLQAIKPAVAKALKDRAILETKAVPRVAAFEAALRAKNLKKARSELDAITARSTSYARLRQSYDQAETAAIREVAARLERVKSGDCKEYDEVVQQEKTVQPPRVADEATKQVQCTPGTAPQPTQCITEIFADQGKEHYAHGRFVAALASYEAAWACGQDPQHGEKAFIVACNIPSLTKAKLFWKRMPQAMQQRTAMICMRNGITEAELDSP